MKKTFIFAILMAASALGAQAQLVVDSLGKVGIGTEHPSGLLNIYIPDTSAYASIPGIKVLVGNSLSNKSRVGIESRVKGTGTYACAIRGLVDSTYYSACVGVMGAAGSWASSAGIYGIGGTYDLSPNFQYSGLYAGYFRGNVRVTNSIYSSAYLTATGGTYYGMDAVNPIGRGIERVADKLAGLQTVVYQRDSRAMNVNAEAAQRNTNQPQLSEIQYGLVAEQLKEVYPELVYEDADGNVSINYVEMIPLLVQSINELSQELAELKGTSGKAAKSKKKNAQATAVEDAAQDMDQVRMDQNKPNPFSGSTVVALSVPETAKSAAIHIYDLSGKQLQKVDVAERGETNITLYASGLSAGMYVYSLVIDGQVKVTRRMMVSEN